MIQKFRVWDKKNCEFILFPHNIVLNIDGTVEGIEYEMPREGIVYNDITYFELLQSTGLFDKNGKEIFEGDIVDCYTEGLSTVEFEHGCFGLVCNGYFEGFVNVLGKSKVIGNIYEHPHLLGEDAQ